MSKFTLPVPEYIASEFTWNKVNGTTCASDLALEAGKQPHSRCYADACDEGLRLINPHTGTTKEYYFTQYKDQCWHYNALCGEAPGTLRIFDD